MRRRDFLMLAAQQTFRTGAGLVVVPVTVTDAKGQRVAGLQAADFVLADNGKAVRFDLEEMNSPVSLVVLVQTSITSSAALEKLVKSGGLFEPLIAGQGGEVALLAYDMQVRTLAPLSGDAEQFENQFRRLRPMGGGGRLHDAVVEAVRILRERPVGRRRVILFIGEAKDLGSETRLDQVVGLAQQANVVVYPVTYSRLATAFTTRTPATGDAATMDILAGLRELGRLSQVNSAAELAKFTGGWVNSFAKLRGLEEAVARIGAELHLQYVLTFTAGAAAAGEYHALHVALTRREGCQLRYRPGYWMEAGVQ